MQRRDFFKILPAASVLNGFPLRPFANSKIARLLAGCEGVSDRVLILIQLRGGNDGLNTLAPIGQYDQYAKLRPTLKVPLTGPNRYLDLDSKLGGLDQIGLHPVLTSLKGMYEKGQVNIVQGVGYQNLNGSHFKGSDLWLSGGDGTREKFNLRSGWMGRALETMFPNVKGAPTPDMKHPLGIQIGDPYPSLGFHTETEHRNSINLYGQDPDGFYSLVQTIGGERIANVPASEYGTELAYIMGVEKSVDLYSEHITAAFKAGRNATTTYPKSGLAAQLRTIARLISGGCKTKMYLCSMGGFDTHGSQIPPEGDIQLGAHANLLKSLADSVKTFLEDLEGLGLGEKVLACTFSEFGRTAKENGASGTDHGTLAPMFVFGKAAKPGVTGTNVNLGNLTRDFQLQGQQFDYRQVFATLIQDWLGGSNAVIEKTLFSEYPKIPIIGDPYVVSPECYIGNTVGVFDEKPIVEKLRATPNPASVQSEIAFRSIMSFEGHLTVHAMNGSLVSSTTVQVEPGTNLFYIDVRSVPTGTYIVRLQNTFNGAATVGKVAVIH